MNFSIKLLTIILLFSSCSWKINKDENDEITSKIIDKDNYCEIVEIKSIGKNEGETFFYKEFLLTLKVNKSCQINLLKNCCVNKLIISQVIEGSATNINEFNSSDYELALNQNLSLNKFLSEETIKIRGFYFGVNKTSNGNLLKEGNCLFFEDNSKIGENTKNLNELYSIGKLMKNYGSEYVKIQNKEEFKILENKAKPADILALNFIGSKIGFESNDQDVIDKKISLLAHQKTIWILQNALYYALDLGAIIVEKK